MTDVEIYNRKAMSKKLSQNIEKYFLALESIKCGFRESADLKLFFYELNKNTQDVDWKMNSYRKFITNNIRKNNERIIIKSKI